MRIAMIGDTKAGKTTYMAMMYQAMVGGFKDFRLATKDTGQGSELLAEAWGIRHSKYPAMTSQRALYEFELSHQRRVFFDFLWSDYRGGALHDRSTEADTAALHADLRAADGIVVFADAERFARDPSAVARHARRLTASCEWAIAQHSGACRCRSSSPTPRPT
ncbi:hypothetical protein ACFQ9X_29285 [Catenulispora yoronensis]